MPDLPALDVLLPLGSPARRLEPRADEADLLALFDPLPCRPRARGRRRPRQHGEHGRRRGHRRRRAERVDERPADFRGFRVCARSRTLLSGWCGHGPGGGLRRPERRAACEAARHGGCPPTSVAVVSTSGTSRPAARQRPFAARPDRRRQPRWVVCARGSARTASWSPVRAVASTPGPPPPPSATGSDPILTEGGPPCWPPWSTRTWSSRSA